MSDNKAYAEIAERITTLVGELRAGHTNDGTPFYTLGQSICRGYNGGLLDGLERALTIVAQVEHEDNEQRKSESHDQMINPGPHRCETCKHFLWGSFYSGYGFCNHPTNKDTDEASRSPEDVCEHWEWPPQFLPKEVVYIERHWETQEDEDE